jgi:hypothetical protein
MHWQLEHERNFTQASVGLRYEDLEPGGAVLQTQNRHIDIHDSHITWGK